MKGAKSNPVLKSTIVMLERGGRTGGIKIWDATSEALKTGSATKIEVNVGHISKVAEPKAAVLVPGKVLGAGSIDKAVTVGAFSFSASARRKISEAGGEAIALKEFVEKFPKGTGVTLVG